MQLSRCQDGYEWIFDPAERLLLIRVFEKVVRDYRTDPKDLSDKVREVWYSAQGRHAADLSPEDFEEWIHQLRQFRSDYATRASTWLHDWKSTIDEPLVWILDSEDFDLFLILINDYRLARAAEMDIGQKEMELSWDDIRDAELRQALIEIHLLAAMIEYLIRLSDN